jgi:hypothetical protein
MDVKVKALKRFSSVYGCVEKDQELPVDEAHLKNLVDGGFVEEVETKPEPKKEVEKKPVSRKRKETK